MNPYTWRRGTARSLSGGLKPWLSTLKPRRGLRGLSASLRPPCPGIPDYYIKSTAGRYSQSINRQMHRRGSECPGKIHQQSGASVNCEL